MPEVPPPPVWKVAAALIIGAAVTNASAAVIAVAARPGDLAAAIRDAHAGDVLRLAAGVHDGGVRIDKALVLEGASGAIVDGGGHGSVITIAAADVTVRHLEIDHSGTALPERDSGVLVLQTAARVHIDDNVFNGNLFGIYLVGPSDARVSGNRIVGRSDPHVTERGDGVSIWNSPGAQIVNNEFRLGRDGIFTTTSHDDLFRNNRFYDLRIAVHYMYTNNSEVSDNQSYGNYAGYALMYSRGLTVRGNLSNGDRDQGILLNYANDSTMEGNTVLHGRNKCVFIYNSNKNRFRGNWFEDCPIGIHFTAGSERNVIADNAFIGNRSQVQYVGTKWVHWSDAGRGNYWSDNPAFDLDGDGIADTAYRPNDLIDAVVWANPSAKLLLTSPAFQLLRRVEGQFPGLHPGGVVDDAPLMRPPAAPGLS